METPAAAQVEALVKAGVARAEAEAAVRAQWDEKEAPAQTLTAGTFAVLRENVEAVELFVRLRNRWQVHGFSGQRIGLLASEVQATMEMLGVKRKRRAVLLEQIELMEDAALEVWDKR